MCLEAIRRTTGSHADLCRHILALPKEFGGVAFSSFQPYRCHYSLVYAKTFFNPDRHSKCIYAIQTTVPVRDEMLADAVLSPENYEIRKTVTNRTRKTKLNSVA
jgi:hypothetical protein